MDIANIKIGKRFRKDLGDVGELAASIDKLGLLQPVVVSADGQLIAGLRRIKAAQKLGWKQVPAFVAKSVTEAVLRLEAERDENTCRKDFLRTEAIAVADAIAEAYKPKAEEAAQEGRKAGASKGGKTAGRGRPIASRGSSPKGKQDESARTTAVAAKAVGMDRRTYEKGKAVVASGDKVLMAEMDRTGKVSGAYKKLKTKEAAAAIAKEPPPLPRGPFRVLVVDPPWQYDSRGNDPTHRAANPYPSMTLAEIMAIPIPKLACADSVLWLWTTNAFLRAAFGIAEAWGFTYKTLLTWAKDRMGTGDWLRGQTEHCLLCIRGKPTIVLTNQTTLLHGPLRKHSQKPEEFYTMVEKLCPGSKVELFQREARDGWIGHGNEALK